MTSANVLCSDYIPIRNFRIRFYFQLSNSFLLLQLIKLDSPIFMMNQDDLDQLRVEFDVLVASMRNQLDVHANQMFNLFVAKINRRTSSVGEPAQSHIKPESDEPNVGDVSIAHPCDANTDQSHPVIGQQPELLASQSDDAELGQSTNPAASGMTPGQ